MVRPPVTVPRCEQWQRKTSTSPSHYTVHWQTGKRTRRWSRSPAPRYTDTGERGPGDGPDRRHHATTNHRVTSSLNHHHTTTAHTTVHTTTVHTTTVQQHAHQTGYTCSLSMISERRTSPDRTLAQPSTQHSWRITWRNTPKNTWRRLCPQRGKGPGSTRHPAQFTQQLWKDVQEDLQVWCLCYQWGKHTSNPHRRLHTTVTATGKGQRRYLSLSLMRQGPSANPPLWRLHKSVTGERDIARLSLLPEDFTNQPRLQVREISYISIITRTLLKSSCLKTSHISQGYRWNRYHTSLSS